MKKLFNMRDKLPFCTPDQTLDILIKFDNGHKVDAAQDLLQIVNASPYMVDSMKWNIVGCYGAIHDMHRQMMNY